MEDAALLGARHQTFDALSEVQVDMEVAEEGEEFEDLVHLERVVPQGLSPSLLAWSLALSPSFLASLLHSLPACYVTSCVCHQVFVSKCRHMLHTRMPRNVVYGFM